MAFCSCDTHLPRAVCFRKQLPYLVSLHCVAVFTANYFATITLLQKTLSNGFNPFNEFFFIMYNKVNMDL